MQRWEYAILTLYHGGGLSFNGEPLPERSQPDHQLKWIGLDGWELVAVENPSYAPVNKIVQVMWYFKRPLKG